MNPKKLTFQNRNGLELAAHLFEPLDRQPTCYAVFAHCFTCTQNFSAVRRICVSLSQQGIAVLSFDFTGLGKSEGDFEESDFSSNVTDLIDAAEFLEKEFEYPKILIGHSLGGTAALFAASQMPNVKAMVTIGSPALPEHVTQLFSHSLDQIQENGSAEVQIGGRPFRISREFVEDLNREPLTDILKKMNQALLIIHSPQDKIVEIQNASEIFKAAKHPKSFVSLEGSDHLISKEDDSEYIGELISSWSKRYVSVSSDPKEKNQTEGNQVKVRLSGPAYTTEIKTPHHHLLADEPLEVGGNNLGPNPYDLLMASLGSCTAMTLKMYAQRKKWDLREVTVFLNHDKIHLNDSNHPDQKDSKVSRFTRIIEIEGDLDKDQKQRLLEISKRCPIHRTLEEEIVIQTLLKKE